MATLAATAVALEKHCGIDAARTRTVARRLLEDELIPPGAPGVAVEIDEGSLAVLLLGVASGAPLRSVADVTTELAESVPLGINISVMPEHLRPKQKTAFEILHNAVWRGAHGPGLPGFDIEIVERPLGVVFHAPEGSAHFHPPGTHLGGFTRSTRIFGAALVDALKELFGGKN